MHLGTLINKQIHEHLGGPLSPDHILEIRLHLAGVVNPSSRQLSRYLRWPKVDADLIKRPKIDRRKDAFRLPVKRRPY